MNDETRPEDATDTPLPDPVEEDAPEAAADQDGVATADASGSSAGYRQEDPEVVADPVPVEPGDEIPDADATLATDKPTGSPYADGPAPKDLP